MPGSAGASRPHARWWPVELVVPKPAPIPWARAVESAVAVGGTFGIGVLSGHTVDGLLASLGALPVVNGDRGGPWRMRAGRMGGSGVGAVVGLVIGALVRGSDWPVVVVVAACAAASGLISAVNPIGSLLGLNLLVYAAISASDRLPGPTWRTAAVALAGGAFALAVKVPGHLARAVTPERAAVAATYHAVADLLDGADRPDRHDRRWALTAALNQAEDGLLAARARLGGDGPATRQLLLQLEQTSGLARVAVQRMVEERRASTTSVLAVRGLAGEVGGLTPDPRVRPDDDDLVEPWEAAARAVRGEHRSGRTDQPEGGRPHLAQMVQRATARRSLEATSRLVVCIVAAEICCVYLVHRHPYWVPLTVAVAMKPDFGSVFARAVQRALGTAVGVLVGGTILVAISDVRELVPFFVVLAALLPVTIVRNYGMFVTVLTPLVLIQIDALTPTPGQLVTARLLDTLLGVGIVLLLGHAVWPSTWRPRLLSDASTALDAVSRSLRTTAAGGDPVAGSRRAGYRALSNVRTTFSQHFADPSPTGTQARILWPLVVDLERILDETVRLGAAAAVVGGVADELDAAADVLDDLRHGHLPASPLPRPGAEGRQTDALWDRVADAVGAVAHLADHDAEGALSRLARARR